ncbi:cell wall-binding repeat-containing protein [Kineococcus rubinsiae]|uniref:cell wall-binding repeat-containing protein n=1 Tax=Kineococcus rubinsiae TaxID=2609562 RepID=UPI001430261E|nr:cell wall-binding repeat-containing protein [Kineococcus rubinsiae]NIZ90485.1 hypothetical protein [Kineococcus rubinsiae]
MPRRPVLPAWSRDRSRAIVACLLAAAVPVVGLAAVPTAQAAPFAPVMLNGMLWAGTGQPGAPVAGPATASPLESPNGVDAAADGTLYIADAGNNQVEKVTPSGELTVVAGNGRPEAPRAGVATASPMSVGDVAVDTSGNVYVTDPVNHRVVRVSAAGALTVIAGSGVNGAPVAGRAVDSPLGVVSAVDVDRAGTVYVADSFNDVVVKITAAGVLSVVNGAAAPVSVTGGLAVDASGNLLVTGYGNDPAGGSPVPQLNTYSPTGVYAAVNLAGDPGDIAVDAQGAVYYSEHGTDTLHVLHPDRTQSTVIATSSTNAPASPLGIAVDALGAVYVSDEFRPTVTKLTDPKSPSPHFTSPAPTSAAYKQPYSHTFTVTGTPAPALSVVGALPAGLTLVGNVLRGTPTALGRTTFTVRAQNTWGREDQIVSFDVGELTLPVVTSPMPLPAVVGRPFRHTFTASGYGTVKWAITGTLPKGLTFDAATATISGVPTLKGNALLTVTATNQAGPGLQPMTLEVQAAPSQPTRTLAAAGDASATVTWSPPLDPGSSPITGYLVVPFANGQPQAPVQAPAQATTVTLSNLTNGAVYIFAVTALNAVGPGLPSNPTTSVVPSVGAPLPVAPAPGTYRFGGYDRVATGVNVSRTLFPSPRSVKAVVLSTSGGYADALAGARLASQHSAPLLLTDGGTLHADVAAEIQRVLAADGTVYVLGGERALSAEVGAAVAALSPGYRVTRLQGENRFSTTAAIATTLSDGGATGPIYLANGLNYPDGLAVSALAAHTGGVLLLTDGETLPQATLDYLQLHDPAGARTVAVGGAAAKAAASSPLPRLTAAAIAQKAVVGKNRYDTARLVAQEFPKTAAVSGAKVTTVGLATGENWPDALVGSAALGNLGGPLLLTPKSALGPEATSAVGALVKGGTVTTGIVLGGRDTVSEGASDAFAKLVPVTK